MYKIFIILILLTNLIAQENKQDTNIHIWNQVEEPSIENNYQYDKKIYQTNDKAQAMSAILIESLYMNKFLEKKKLQTNFKYLKDFD